MNYTSRIFTAILFMTTSPMLMTAQEKFYILLDTLDSLYTVTHYTLNTMELYGVDETVELFNVHAEGLVLFSVLPDFYSESNWTETDNASIQHRLIDGRAFQRMVAERLVSGNGSDKKSLNFVLVRSMAGKLLKSNVCLTEFFTEENYPNIFNVPFGTINIGQDTLSIRRMQGIYTTHLSDSGKWVFPLDLNHAHTILPNRKVLEREYLSRVFVTGGKTAYKFWTFTDWSGQDGYQVRRGIDRFIYIPEQGIVGGSFDFYFCYQPNWKSVDSARKRHTKTREELWQNVLAEKVMLPEELK